MGKIISAQRHGRGSVFKSHVHKRLGKVGFRPLDFVERRGYVKGVIRNIVHDVGRGAPVALIEFKDPLKYRRQTFNIVATEGIYSGQYVYCGKKAQMAVGNILPVGQLQEGAIVHSVERKPGDRGSVARSSGEYCVIISHNKDTGKTRLKFPSGQKRNVLSSCRAQVGIVAGGGRVEKPLLKAGNAYHRFKHRRNCWPVVRGVAKNPVEHPHGGGNHQHVGHPTTVQRLACPGQKCGLIAASRTGRIRGGKKVVKGGDKD